MSSHILAPYLFSEIDNIFQILDKWLHLSHNIKWNFYLLYTYPLQSIEPERIEPMNQVEQSHMPYPVLFRIPYYVYSDGYDELHE